MALAPGVRLGPYAIVSALGAGGMGEVSPGNGHERKAKVLDYGFGDCRVSLEEIC